MNTGLRVEIDAAHLASLANQLEVIHRHLSAEVALRNSLRPGERPVWAVDFGVIFEYLNQGVTKESESNQRGLGLATAALDSLVRSSDLFTLLPGTVHEILYFYSKQARILPPVHLADDLLSWVSRDVESPAFSELRFDEAVRRRLLTLLDEFEIHSSIAGRLSSLLSSANLVSIRDAGVPAQDRWTESSTGHIILDYLGKRRWCRQYPNRIDSLNSSIVLGLLRNRDRVPVHLVTQSILLQNLPLALWFGSNSADEREAFSAAPITAPARLILSIRFQECSIAEVRGLTAKLASSRQKVARFAGSWPDSAVQKPRRLFISREQALDLTAALRAIDEAAGSLTELLIAARSIDRVLAREVAHIPESLDLKELAATGLEAVTKLKSEINRTSSRLAGLLEPWQQAVHGLGLSEETAHWDSLRPLFGLLESTSRQVVVDIDKLIVLGEAVNIDLSSLKISGSTIGLLNRGDLRHVKKIDARITTLAKSGEEGMSNALREISEAVAASSELDEKLRSQTLEQLEELASQAENAKKGSARGGIVAALLAGLATSLGSAGDLAEVWSTWGSEIREFFSDILFGS